MHIYLVPEKWIFFKLFKSSSKHCECFEELKDSQ